MSLKLEYFKYKKKSDFDFIKTTMYQYSLSEVDRDFVRLLESFEPSEKIQFIIFLSSLPEHKTEIQSSWITYLLPQVSSVSKEKLNSPEFYQSVASLVSSAPNLTFDFVDWISKYLFEAQHLFQISAPLFTQLMKEMRYTSKQGHGNRGNDNHMARRAVLVNLLERQQVSPELHAQFETDFLYDIRTYCFQDRFQKIPDEKKVEAVLEKDELAKFLPASKIQSAYFRDYIGQKIANLFTDRTYNPLQFVKIENSAHITTQRFANFRLGLRAYRQKFQIPNLQTELQTNPELQFSFLVALGFLGSFKDKDMFFEGIQAQLYANNKEPAEAYVRKTLSHIQFSKILRTIDIETASLQKTFGFTTSQMEQFIELGRQLYVAYKHNKNTLQLSAETFITKLALMVSLDNNEATVNKSRFKI